MMYKILFSVFLLGCVSESRNVASSQYIEMYLTYDLFKKISEQVPEKVNEIYQKIRTMALEEGLERTKPLVFKFFFC